jgi:tRNA (mo5U34)-methyltransferase
MNRHDPITDPEQIRSLMGSFKNWYHQIELAPGVVTPGSNLSGPVLQRLDALGLPRDCSKLRVLDIGCRDGFFAFEMERRGAEVVGMDYAAPEVTGFSIASRILGSRVTYVVENVYRLAPEKHGLFDIVLFLGVLYHLRNPLLAFDQVRKVAKPDGLLFVETHVTVHPVLKSLGTPAWEYYPRDTLGKDETNKWGPNVAGLKAVMEEAQFAVLDSAVYGDRCCVKARTVTDERKEHFRRLDSSVGLWGRI